MGNPSGLHNPILGNAPKGGPREECLSTVESCMHVFPIACAVDIAQDAVNDKRVEIAGKCVLE